ncbi:TetR/AcrR family transcriptional regulator [Pontibacter sp. G13]|uniref:TetR/AcrR family transcriptional regulator n=1 Tax=Pontibacter sp. G13 TaxID=3074898 RepID=UPI002889B2FB|nr:TetR/AcrR family transcriptional regulator [Pontibacter sp. G13]WNJ16978.1 TetR/AcrR family transcriptional regulator [Pontibacter sp. G13]
MGIAERKAREKQEMRTKIIQAAQEMFVELGYDKTSIRKVADRIEYSPATIYLYFKNKDDLFFEIHELLFNQLAENLRKTDPIEHPIERLRDMGRRYIQFGMENPMYYDLMFIARAPMNAIHEEESWECAFETFDVLEKTVKDGIDQGYLRDMDPGVLSFTVWSHVHGMVSLYLRDRMKMFPPEIQIPLMNQSLDTMLDMLQCKP